MALELKVNFYKESVTARYHFLFLVRDKGVCNVRHRNTIFSKVYGE